MKALRQMGGGFLIAVVSILLVIGGISLSLAETFAPSIPPTPSPLPTTFAVEFASPLPSPTSPLTLPTNTLAPAPTATIQTVCIIPPGWVPVTVGAADTLYTIAERYKTTAESLNQANCLNNLPPAAGTTLYVPPVPTVTVIPCGPPPGWVKTHLVKPGENLYRISLLYRTTVALLQSANCMGTSTLIHVGQALWVPNVPTSTPAFTATPLSTNTLLPSTETSTPTITPDFGTPTFTPSPTPSITPFPSSTPSQ